jgi:hypothetical protein
VRTAKAKRRSVPLLRGFALGWTRPQSGCDPRCFSGDQYSVQLSRMAGISKSEDHVSETSILGRQRFIAFTTQPNQQGLVTTLLDRVGSTFQCFDTPAQIGSNYVCAQICNDEGKPSQELRAQVTRQVPVSEVRALLKQHPNGNRLKLDSGKWYEIHAD